MDQPLTISGAAGNLQARLTSAETSAIAVLCHPHPLYGGNMQDAVLDVLADVLVEQEITCLRFNFRGVGTSDGEYHGDGGEVDDLRAVIDWVHAELKPRHLVLGREWSVRSKPASPAIGCSSHRPSIDYRQQRHQPATIPRSR
jgi:alpha/beta superfamily hydrolase